MGIAITRFDATDQPSAIAAHGVAVAAFGADVPDLPPWSRRAFLGSVAHPHPGKHFEWALARLDGEPAGYVQIELPLLDNTDNAAVELYVHPAHRRKGVGRALHAYTVRVARANDRKRLASFTISGLPGGPPRSAVGDRFAEAMGASAVLHEVRRRLDLATLDETALDEALAKAWRHAAGYTLVRWRGPAPEAYVADVAYLDGRLIADAPMGDLAWEPERVDVERVRGTEALHELRGRRMYHTGVCHEATGRLVAWTTLALSDEPDWQAWQQITIVDPEHRGHRLGTIIKIENLRHTLAAEPALRYIDTCNADTNDYMVSINELLGFRPVDSFVNWQQAL